VPRGVSTAWLGYGCADDITVGLGRNNAYGFAVGTVGTVWTRVTPQLRWAVLELGLCRRQSRRLRADHSCFAVVTPTALSSASMSIVWL